MKTPYGKECKHYYADYYRGKNTQECRLIQANRALAPWKPALCQTCPVPGILEANGSPRLILRAKVGKTFFGLVQQVKVTAFCSEHRVEVPNPKVGCSRCRLEADQATIERIKDEG